MRPNKSALHDPLPCILCVKFAGDYGSNAVETVQVHNPVTNTTIAENVFACYGKVASKPPTKYLISKEYNVSDVPGQHIAGRFIFTETNNIIQYAALAEEPAKVVRGKNVENVYFKLRGNRKPGTSIFDLKSSPLMISMIIIIFLLFFRQLINNQTTHYVN